MAELDIVEELTAMDEAQARDADPDRDIARLAAAGGLTTALGLLMRRYGTSVYRYCRESLRDRTLADDVHQQIFIQAYRDLPRFAGRSSLRTWLFAIARHRVLDAAKMRRRAYAHVEHDAAADAADPTPSAGDLIDDARLGRDLIDGLGELGEPLRTALLLRYQQGFTFEEMAELCGEKPGTLQARVTRALPRLRAFIEARGRAPRTRPRAPALEVAERDGEASEGERSCPYR